MYGGLTLLAYPRSNSASNVIYFTEDFDVDEMAFLRRYLTPGDCFVDCGANIGTYTLLAASLVGRDGRVISYEPGPAAFRRLVENVELNNLEGVVTARQAAVGAERGILAMTATADVSNTLVGLQQSSRPTVDVEVTVLDQQEVPVDVALVKIDVEGYELAALAGMAPLVKAGAIPVLLMEFTPHLLRRAGTSASELGLRLRDQGYELFTYSAADNELVPIDQGGLEDDQANYLVIHHEAVENIASRIGAQVAIGSRPAVPARAAAPSRRPFDATKRGMDVVLGGIALLVSAPVQGVVAAAVLTAHGRPVLFRQQRPGRHGRPFTILKFRTMRHPDAVHVTDAERLTGLGRFLRASSLDELPELVNVVRGDMSLVGPRPLLMEYLERYTPQQARRHEVRPGLTGLAQVAGRNALTWEEKFAFDVEYVERRSLGLDLSIIARTIAMVLLRRGISADGEATMPVFVGSSA